jgi:hypothetical protein
MKRRETRKEILIEEVEIEEVVVGIKVLEGSQRTHEFI